MRVVVTGGAGYIGSHAVRALLKQGHDVWVVDNLSHGYQAAVQPPAHFVNLDVADRPTLADLLRKSGIEAVLHFAAFIEVGESVKNPGKYYANNFSNGVSLLHAMRDANVKQLVFSSTAAVYGNPIRTPIDEDHPRDPINPYGRSKWMMEQAIADFSLAHGLGYAVLRYFNVAGASPDSVIGEAHEPESHLIPRVLAAAGNPKMPVNIFGTDYPTQDGTCIRDYVHVEDLVEAHLLALKAIEPGRGRTCNLGSENGFSVREVIEVCKKVTGRDIPVKEEARRPGDPAVLVATSNRIRAELGWTRRYAELETMVAHAWAWHQSHPQGYAQVAEPARA
jgi:UDP-glucose 4-epimerase